MINHVSFDFDGVIIDSLECMEYAWSHSCSILDIDKRFSEYIPFIGIPFDKILEMLSIAQEKRGILTKSYNILASSRCDLIHIYPNIKDVLNYLQEAGVVTTLVTSKSKKRTFELLRHFGLDTFESVVTPNDVELGRGKPSPDPLILACKEVNKCPASTVYIGDMKSDYDCATSAGASFCYASWGYGNQSWLPRNVVSLSSPYDLRQYFQKILQQTLDQ
jgi:HAD superfamily hydrolase (TIGR01549 family)